MAEVHLHPKFCEEWALQAGVGTSLPPSTSDPMKVLSSLASAKRRHADCQVVKRKGTLYVINKTNPRFKARQGSTKGTKMSKKGVN